MKKLRVLVSTIAVSSALTLASRVSITTIIIASSMLFTPGCATNSTPSLTAQQAAPLLSSVVSGGIIYGYSQDTNTVTYATAAKAALEGLVLSTNLSPAQVQQVLAAIPVSGLSTPIAKIIENTLVGAYRSFAASYVYNNVQSNADLAILLQAVVDGIDQGLASTGFEPVTGKFSARAPVSASRKDRDVANWKSWKAKHLKN